LSRRKKNLFAFIVVAALAIGLQYTFWFGKHSVSTLKETRSLIELETTHNKEITKRNNIVKAEIIDLKTGDETMEERARMELGLVKDGETFYRIVETE
jgi:cell division protein FtsB